MTSTRRRLVVRADDVGSSWAANVGCLKACTDGIARTVEVMMPCAWISHAAQLFSPYPQIDVGIHLTLTSEWDAVRWRPLTNVPSLTDADGWFLPQIWTKEGAGTDALSRRNWRIEEVEQEFRAQISLGLKMFPGASHISSHMLNHFRALDHRLGTVIKTLCREFGLADDPLADNVQWFEAYPAEPRDAVQRTGTFVKRLEEFGPGDRFFIDHPAMDTPEMRATGHDGYRDVAEDRASCLEVLINPVVISAIAEQEIELISCKALCVPA